MFAYGTLDKNNRWVKMADILDWDKIEVVYVKKFVKNGNRAKNVRMALGSLIIKQTLNCSDVETVNQICENPYLQYFIGLKEYTDVAPFTSQSMTEFRKRFSEGEILKFINELIIGDKNSDKTAHKISDKTSIKKTQNTTIKPPKKDDTSTDASIADGDKMTICPFSQRRLLQVEIMFNQRMTRLVCPITGL